jgi:putative acetyltransferase
MIVQPADFSDPQIIALLNTHLSEMHKNTPAGGVYALDLRGLQSADVSFYGVWNGQTLVGMGALRELNRTTGEVKSMRTHSGHLRQGVAAAMLHHLISTARSRGYERLSLETGTGPDFEPALALYRRHGFVDGEPFGDYEPSEFNQFLHLDLKQP